MALRSDELGAAVAAYVGRCGSSGSSSSGASPKQCYADAGYWEERFQETDGVLWVGSACGSMGDRSVCVVVCGVLGRLSSAALGPGRRAPWRSALSTLPALRPDPVEGRNLTIRAGITLLPEPELQDKRKCVLQGARMRLISYIAASVA